MKRAPLRVLVGLASLAVAVILPGAAAGSLEAADPARRLEYRVAWNGIPAANATVRIEPKELAGDRGYVIHTSARTNRFIDVFWKFRGEARSTFLASGIVPLHFVYDRTINGVPSLTWIDFRPVDQRAQSVYIQNGRRKKELDIESLGIVDPITAVFQARMSEVDIGAQIPFEVFTGESRYLVELSVDGHDVVDVPAGRFDAFKVTPQVWKLHGDERPPDERLRHATIWVGSDPARTLLRIRSEMFVGAVTLDLVEAEPLT